jgi:hypothetical protein
MLLASFLCIFVSLFLPIWGGHGNGLDAADNMFNRLSKGSSYFIPGVQKQVLELDGKTVTITAKVKDPKLAARAVENLTKAGATAEFKDDAITYPPFVKFSAALATPTTCSTIAARPCSFHAVSERTAKTIVKGLGRARPPSGAAEEDDQKAKVAR